MKSQLLPPKPSNLKTPRFGAWVGVFEIMSLITPCFSVQSSVTHEQDEQQLLRGKSFKSTTTRLPYFLATCYVSCFADMIPSKTPLCRQFHCLSASVLAQKNSKIAGIDQLSPSEFDCFILNLYCLFCLLGTHPRAFRNISWFSGSGKQIDFYF